MSEPLELRFGRDLTAGEVVAMVNELKGPVLTIRRDARFECEGVVAECREEEPRFLLTFGLDNRDSRIKATLTEREAVALGGVLQAVVSWFRSQESPKAGSP